MKRLFLCLALPLLCTKDLTPFIPSYLITALHDLKVYKFKIHFIGILNYTYWTSRPSSKTLVATKILEIPALKCLIIKLCSFAQDMPSNPPLPIILVGLNT